VVYMLCLRFYCCGTNQSSLLTIANSTDRFRRLSVHSLTICRAKFGAKRSYFTDQCCRLRHAFTYCGAESGAKATRKLREVRVAMDYRHARLTLCHTTLWIHNRISPSSQRGYSHKSTHIPTTRSYSAARYKLSGDRTRKIRLCLVIRAPFWYVGGPRLFNEGNL
jgi:hypothetical protein